MRVMRTTVPKIWGSSREAACHMALDEGVVKMKEAWDFRRGIGPL
jgi:hypothetical protein